MRDALVSSGVGQGLQMRLDDTEARAFVTIQHNRRSAARSQTAGHQSVFGAVFPRRGNHSPFENVNAWTSRSFDPCC